MQSRKTNINSLTPAHSDFDLLFQLCEIVSSEKGILLCKIVDDTGLVNACFNAYIDKLQVGIVYHMTHLKTDLDNGSLRVMMSSQTAITKQPDTLGFKDKSNNISKKKFDQPALLKQVKQKPVLDQVPEKKQESIIPFTPEQAELQKKLTREFYQEMHPSGGRRVTGGIGQKDLGEKNRYRPKEGGEKKVQKLGEKKVQKLGDKKVQKFGEEKQKPKYIQKEGASTAVKAKKKYEAKEEAPREKAKSMLYKQKV